MSINKVILIGHLGRDPETRTTSSGATMARLNIATGSAWTDKSGQKQQTTEWHRVVAWDKTAEVCSKYLTKGRQVYIEGRLQTRSWEDEQGQKRYTTEVVANRVEFLGQKGADMENNNLQGQGTDPQNGTQNEEFGPEPKYENSEKMPF